MSAEFSKIKTQIEVCASETDKLNDWENQFIESVSDTFTRTGTLTLKQMSTLDRIYQKVA